MSWQAVQAVMDYSRSKGTERMVLMVVATHADKDTMTTFIGLDRLCAEANMKARNLQYTIAKLRDAGELKIDVQAGRGNVNLFTLTLPIKGAADCTISEGEKVQPIAPFTEDLTLIKRCNVASEKVQSKVKKVQSSVEKVQPIAPIPVIQPRIQPERVPANDDDARARDPLAAAEPIDVLTSTGEGPVESGAGLAEVSPGNSKPHSSSVGAARTPTGKGMATRNPSCGPSPPKPETKTETPDTFTPDAALVAWAREHTPAINLTLETDAFLDWNRERGKQRNAEGWRHAWRNWMRNAVKFEARDGPARSAGQARAAPGRQSNVEKSMSAVRQRLAEIEVERCQQTHLSRN